jgi:uncharacterized membrane protein
MVDPVGPLSQDLATLLVPVLMAALVGVFLWVLELPVTRGVVLALTPWMVVGAAGHALYTMGAYDRWAEVLFGPVGAYFTTFVLAGMVWSMMGLAARIDGDAPLAAQYLTAAGTGAALVSGGVVLSAGQGADFSRVYPTFGGLLVTLVIAAGASLLLNYVYSQALVQTGLLGFFAVFGHALDAVMTAVSVDMLGESASYTLGQRVLAVAADLPTAGSVGTGWLLVVVRVVGAVAVVVAVGYLLTRREIKERPAPAYLFLGLVTAYGLGPGMHHFFTILVST